MDFFSFEHFCDQTVSVLPLPSGRDQSGLFVYISYFFIEERENTDARIRGDGN